jgi:hypothetical protein
MRTVEQILVTFDDGSATRFRRINESPGWAVLLTDRYMQAVGDVQPAPRNGIVAELAHLLGLACSIHPMQTRVERTCTCERNE